VSEEKLDYELPEPGSIYDVFETSDKLEAQGMWFDYAFGKFKLAYVGGANQDFQREFAERMKPHLEAQQRGVMDPEIARKIQIECYVNHVVKDWRDVIGRDGKTLKFNTKNAVKLFLDLPHLFTMIRSAATDFSNFKKIYEDQVLGN
jgi:hypothetical protein